MFLVAFYFLLLTIISYGLGICLSRILPNKVTLTDQLFLGLAGITIFASLWAIWLPLNHHFTLILSAISLCSIGFYSRFKETATAIQMFFADLKSVMKFTFILSIVALSASMQAYAIDNEAYYIQTIKWLDEYGLVIGLGNLHSFFYQQSGVHILQAALNFDSVYARFNDISAFFLLIGLCWSAFAKAESTSSLAINLKDLFPVALFLFLLFSTAPTPDIPVYVLSYYVIYKFLCIWEKYEDSQLLVMSICCLLIAYFKIIAVLIFILPLVIIFKNSKQRSYIFYQIIGLGLLFFGTFLIKNILISGLPFYPVTTWTPVEFSWQVNLEIANHYKELTAAQPFHKWPTFLEDLGILGKAKLWLFYPGLESYLNWLTLLSCLMSVIFIWRSRRPRLQVISTIFLIQSCILFITSPQFRFFLNLLYPVLILMFIHWYRPNKKLCQYLIIIGYSSGLLLFSAPQMISFLTDNPAMKNNIKLEASMLFHPSPVSKYSSQAHEFKEGNLIYYYSKEDDRIWNTNNVPLPAIQKQYIDYYKKYFHSRPQLRTSRLKDGFYSDSDF